MADKKPDQPDPKDEQELSYEAAREELVETVRRLEAGGTTLEESLALWERGEQARHDLPAVARRGAQAAGRDARGDERRTMLRRSPQPSWRCYRPRDASCPHRAIARPDG